MIRRILPFGLVVILVIGMLPADEAWGHKLIRISGEKLPVEKTQENCLPKGERFAIVDEQALLRFLSREEFELLKTLNLKLIEMKACHIVYLTEILKRKTPPPAVLRKAH